MKKWIKKINANIERTQIKERKKALRQRRDSKTSKNANNEDI